MTGYKVDQFVSQAESEGCTLADVLTSRLSANDLDALQLELTQKMAENYRTIEGFMADVEVPSVADFSGFTGQELDEMQSEVLAALSDEPLLA
ncbi:MAG: hypothetical protein AB7S97_04610 [Thermoplasmata archaeon]